MTLLAFLVQHILILRYLPALLPMFVPAGATQAKGIHVIYAHEEWRHRLTKKGEPVVSPPTLPQLRPAPKANWFQRFSGTPQELGGPVPKRGSVIRVGVVQ